MESSAHIEMRVIPEQDLPRAVAIISERLCDFQEIFRERYAKFRELFVGFYIGDALIGLCYGWPAESDICLQGIAVKEEFAAKGYGSRLLGFFEDQVRIRGDHSISVGSAGGYVEHFYLKNGYRAVQYFLCIPRDRRPEEYRNMGYELINERTSEDTIRFNIATDRYDPLTKDALWNKFNAIEVGYIFEKVVA